MNPYAILALALTGLGMLVGCWLGWQLLRQNGRLLLRLEELEKRLDELEFGEGEDPAGLPAGNEAPEFELPDLAGEHKSLAQFRGQPVLLVFFNPDCGFCREVMPKLATFRSFSEPGRADLPVGPDARQRVPTVLVISTGDAEKNRQLFAEHKIGCPVLLQKDGEVAKAYLAHGTPSGYLVNAEGKIASPLAMGADALLKLATEPHSGRGNEAQPSTLTPQPDSQSLLTSAPTTGDGRAKRFGNRSLAGSKIKRDGLKAGTPAPDFHLPRLDGRGALTLSELRGKRVLLVFSSPGCGPCNALAPALEKFHRSRNGGKESSPSPRPSPPGEGERSSAVEVVMISKGEPSENRAKVKDYGLTFPILLQQQWEISRRYAMFATPIAYLIDERGVIAHDVAVGAEAIQALLTAAAAGRAGESGSRIPLKLALHS